MADEVRDEATASTFTCSFCQRVFSKKEHLKRHERAHTGSKPFKCGICNRGFSRGDVLNRHVKGHKQTATPRQSSIDTSNQGMNQNTVTLASGHESHGQSTNAFAHNSLVSANLSHEHTIHNVEPVIWGNSLAAQPDTSSSLLWPDSEDFFQSLTSNDAMAWDQSMPNFNPSISIPQNALSVHLPLPASAETNTSPYDEPTATEDGRRAVHTTNGLLTNTLLNVTSNAALFDLTPRFLDSSLHTFFTKFNPILPIIHRPTFIYRECSAPLLLNAIALGSLFLGTEDATITGECLWRLAHTAIATSWPDMIDNRREHDLCSGVELVVAALLSQAYAALSKNRTLRMTSQTFYGLSMHWAQYCGMYDVGRIDLPETPKQEDAFEAKTYAWRSWVARETQVRTLLGLCVIDSVVSQFSGNFVNTWAATNSLPLAADDKAFAADNVDDWITSMITCNTSTSKKVLFSELCHEVISNGLHATHLSQISTLLNIKILLEILGSLSMDYERANRGPVGDRANTGALKALGSIRHVIADCSSLTTADRAIGLLRWHAVCLDLAGNTAKGARRMCYYHGITQHIFGGRKRQEPGRIDAQRWIRGLPARKCLLHALEIHKIASEIPLGIIHDTCLPGALFAAATTYSSFALPGLTKVFVPEVVHWDDVISCGLDDQLASSVSSRPGASDTTFAFLRNTGTMQTKGWVAHNLLYELSSVRILLHSLSQHWGVTQEMEEVIGSWEAHCS